MLRVSVMAPVVMLTASSASQAAPINTVLIDFLDPVASTTAVRDYGAGVTPNRYWNQIPLNANKQSATLPSTALVNRDNTASGITVSAPDFLVGGYTNGSQGYAVTDFTTNGFTFPKSIMDSIIAEDFQGSGATARNGLMKFVFTSPVQYSYDFLIASSMGEGSNADGEWLTTINLGYGATYGGKTNRTFSGGDPNQVQVTIDSALGSTDRNSASLTFTSVLVGSEYVAELQIAVGNQNTSVINRQAVLNALKLEYSAVPEPTTAVIGLALAGLALRRRTRQR